MKLHDNGRNGSSPLPPDSLTRFTIEKQYPFVPAYPGDGTEMMHLIIYPGNLRNYAIVSKPTDEVLYLPRASWNYPEI